MLVGVVGVVGTSVGAPTGYEDAIWVDEEL